MTLEKWLEIAKMAAEYQWGYADLLKDHPTRFAALYGIKMDPYTAAEEVGEKYDLMRVDSWNMEPVQRTKERFYAQFVEQRL